MNGYYITLLFCSPFTWLLYYFLNWLPYYQGRTGSTKTFCFVHSSESQPTISTCDVPCAIFGDSNNAVGMCKGKSFRYAPYAPSESMRVR
jgi:hypothetical protein